MCRTQSQLERHLLSAARIFYGFLRGSHTDKFRGQIIVCVSVLLLIREY